MSPMFLKLYKELPLCEGRAYNTGCLHYGQIHDKILKLFLLKSLADEYFDPLKLCSSSRIDPAVHDPFHVYMSNRSIAYFTMIGAIVVALALGEKVVAEAVLGC